MKKVAIPLALVFSFGAGYMASQKLSPLASENAELRDQVASFSDIDTLYSKAQEVAEGVRNLCGLLSVDRGSSIVKSTQDYIEGFAGAYAHSDIPLHEALDLLQTLEDNGIQIVQDHNTSTPFRFFRDEKILFVSQLGWPVVDKYSLVDFVQMLQELDFQPEENITMLVVNSNDENYQIVSSGDPGEWIIQEGKEPFQVPNAEIYC